MQSEELIRLLNENGVAIYTPDTFDYSSLYQKMDTHFDSPTKEFVSLTDESCILRFDTSYHDETGEPYCTISYENGIDEGVLLSEDDKGRQIGHEGNVSHFIDEFFKDGFYEMNEAEDKIDGFQESYVEAEEEASLQRLELEGLQIELERTDDKPTVMELDLDGNEAEKEMQEFFSEENLENAPLEIQEQELVEAAQDGRLEQILNEMNAAAPLSAEEKFENAGIDRNLSEETKTYIDKVCGNENYTEIIKTGFIPYPLREGYFGRDSVSSEEKISQTVINEIRTKIDPDFGMVMGVDTSKFIARNSEGTDRNIFIIPLKYNDIEPYIQKNDCPFQQEDIKGIRAIKEQGDCISVRGEQFAVNNIVTFEVYTKDKEVYRSTVVMDDTGRVRGNLYGIATDDRSGSISFGDVEIKNHAFEIYSGDKETDLSSIHIDKLDRTNIDNQGHFRSLNGKDENYVESFRQQAMDGIPDFLERYCEKHEEKMDDYDSLSRKDYMEIRMQDLESYSDALHNILNTIGLYQDSLEAKAYSCNLKAREINDEIVRLDVSRNDLELDSKEYNQISEKIEENKMEWAKTYKEYSCMIQKIGTFMDEVQGIRNISSNIDYEKNQISIEYNEYFKKDDVLDKMDVSTGNESIQDRYQRICDVESVRGTQLPSNVTFDIKAIIHEKFDVIKEAVDGIKDIVEKYNDSVDSQIEKIQITEKEVNEDNIDKFAVYTNSGYEILSKSEINEIDKYTSYKSELDNTKDSENLNNPYISSDGKVDYISSKEYAESVIEGQDITRETVSTKFISVAINDGHDKDKITLRDNSSTNETVVCEFEKVKDIIDADPEHIDINNIEINIKDVAQDTDIESPVQDEKKTYKNEELDNRISRIMNGAYGKIDVSKEIAISEEKYKELEIDSKVEAKNTGKDEKNILESKIEKLEYKLNQVKNDIIHYQDKMGEIDYISAKSLNSHTGYQLAKNEFDSAIHFYEKLGGKVGNDEFVEKGVSKNEMMENKSGVMRTNIITTMICDSMNDTDSIDYIKNLNVRKEKQEYESDHVISYGGKESGFVKLYTEMTQIISIPTVVVNNLIMRLLDNKSEYIEKMIDKNYLSREEFLNKMDDVTSSEKEPEHKDVLNQESDIEKKETSVEKEEINKTENDVVLEESKENVFVLDNNVNEPFEFEENKEAEKDETENVLVEESQDATDSDEGVFTKSEESEQLMNEDVEVSEENETENDFIDGSDDVVGKDLEHLEDSNVVDLKEEDIFEDNHATEDEYIDTKGKEDIIEADDKEKTIDDEDETDLKDNIISEDFIKPEESKEDVVVSEETEQNETELDTSVDSKEMIIEKDVISEGIIDKSEESSFISDEHEKDTTDTGLSKDEVVSEKEKENAILFEEKKYDSYQSVDESESKESTIEHLSSKIGQCMSGQEELSEVMRSITDMLEDGTVSSTEVIPAITSGIESQIESGNLEAATDVVFETICSIGDSFSGTFDSLTESLEDSSIPNEDVFQIMSDASIMFFDAAISNDIEYTNYNEVTYGEIDGIGFFPNETIDLVSGEIPDTAILEQSLMEVDMEMNDIDYSEEDALQSYLEITKPEDYDIEMDFHNDFDYENLNDFESSYPDYNTIPEHQHDIEPQQQELDFQQDFYDMEVAQNHDISNDAYWDEDISDVTIN